MHPCGSSSSRLRHRQHPHALICPLPAQGHVNPLLSLATLLTSRGIAVSFICAEHRIAPLRSDRSLLANPLLRLVGMPERIPPGDIAVDQGFEGLIWGKALLDNMKDDFVEFVRICRADTAAESSHGPPDCIVADAFTAWSRVVAADLAIPLYTFFTSPGWNLTVMIRVPLLTAQGLIPVRSSDPPQLMSVPGLPPLLNTDILDFMMDVVPVEIRELVSNCALIQSQSSRILLNTVYEIEAPYIDALEKDDPYKTKLKILTIGPLLPSEHLDGDHEHLPAQVKLFSSKVQACFEWLATQAPASVLYISFGSMYIPCDEEILELAHGLEASSHPFLWILRRSPHDVSKDLASWLSRVLPEGFRSRTQGKGFILTEWAPQRLILSSPAVACFWTHCGWNSILESVSRGVPLIAYPQFADQKHNCRMIVDQLQFATEIKKDVSRGFPGRETVEKEVRRAMKGEESEKIKRQVEKARDTMKRAVKENGSSHRNLEMIVQEIYQAFDGNSMN